MSLKNIVSCQRGSKAPLRAQRFKLAEEKTGASYILGTQALKGYYFESYREAKSSKTPLSLGYHGNIVDLW